MPAALQGQSPAPLGTKPSSLPSPCSVLRVLAGAVLPADPHHAAEDTGDAQVGPCAPSITHAMSLSLSPSPASASLPRRSNLKALYQGAVLDVFYKAHILRPSRQAIVCWMSFASFQTAFACLGMCFWGGYGLGGGGKPHFQEGTSYSSGSNPLFWPHFTKLWGFCSSIPSTQSVLLQRGPNGGRKGGPGGGGGGRMEGSESRLGSSPDSLIREAVAASHAKACLSPSAPAVASQSLCHGM